LNGLKRHLEGVYIEEKSVSQLLLILFEFLDLKHTDYMEIHTAPMDLNLLRSGLYFDHNFFIRTPIWMIEDAFES
jgi:hypothetical protein